MTDYSADSIQVLQGTEAIRRRPGMYLGVGADGTARKEILFTALFGRAGALFARHRDALLSAPPSLERVGDEYTYTDPVAVPSERGRCTLAEFVSLARFGRGCPYHSDITLLIALSESLVIDNFARGEHRRIAFREGAVWKPAHRVDRTTRAGIKIRFRFDPSLTGTQVLSDEEVLLRAWDVACANRGLRFDIEGSRVFAPNGVRDHAVFQGAGPMCVTVGRATAGLTWDPMGSAPAYRVASDDPFFVRLRGGREIVPRPILEAIARGFGLSLPRAADLLPGLRLVVRQDPARDSPIFAAIEEAAASWREHFPALAG
ncbi:MAG: hypothetical protein AAGE52_06745 [Myxococcota bacterium]